jgi:L-fucose isomerase-like protein
MPPKIGVLLIGHPDYPNDIGLQFATEPVRALEARGMQVLFEPSPLTRPPAAREAGIRLAGQDPDGVIVFLGTWIECPTALQAIREIEHLPFAVWGYNMFPWQGKRESTGSFVAAAVLKGALGRMQYRPACIIGLPAEEHVVDRAAVFCRAAHAIKRLKRTRIALVGYAAMGMYPGTFDHVLMRRRIGPEVEQTDTYTLIRAAEAIPEEVVRATAEELRAKADVRAEDDRLLKSARLAAGLRQIVRDGAFDAVNVKCQYELSQQYGMTACIPVSLIADDGVVAGCEGDLVTTVTQCLLQYITGEVGCYGDILDLAGRRMLLSSCGFAPFSLCNPEGKVCICELGYPGFDGLISSCTLRRGPVTFARLVEGTQGDYRLNYGTGTGVETDLRQGRFPALEVELDGDPERLWETIASQHFALCYGDVSAEIEDACRWLGVATNRV